MHVGVVFPQTEIGTDPGSIREYAQAAEDLGYSHILAYEHILGAGTATRPKGTSVYTYKSMFHEPFVLFGYLAAITRRIGLVPGVIILPQRQAALVAKQAAEVDVLSGGRLRLGIGLGRNPVEYEALGEDFHNRGKRFEEQVRVLKALWTQELVTFHGQWHRITDAGINPLPVQRPIPLWMGGGADRAVERIARLADGWLLRDVLSRDTGPAVKRFRELVRQAGRDPKDVGMEGRLSAADGTIADWVNAAKVWAAHGADYVCFNTMGCGFASVSDHVNALRRFNVALDEAGLEM